MCTFLVKLVFPYFNYSQTCKHWEYLTFIQKTIALKELRGSTIKILPRFLQWISPRISLPAVKLGEITLSFFLARTAPRFSAESRRDFGRQNPGRFPLRSRGGSRLYYWDNAINHNNCYDDKFIWEKNTDNLYVRAWTNKKCLATKHHQTLFGHQTC